MGLIGQQDTDPTGFLWSSPWSVSRGNAALSVHFLFPPAPPSGRDARLPWVQEQQEIEWISKDFPLCSPRHIQQNRLRRPSIWNNSTGRSRGGDGQQAGGEVISTADRAQCLAVIMRPRHVTPTWQQGVTSEEGTTAACIFSEYPCRLGSIVGASHARNINITGRTHVAQASGRDDEVLN